MSEINLPFKVGDIVELKSFDDGYRGAWFNCKIIKQVKKAGELIYKLKYPDYPGEGIDTSKVFQTRKGVRHLMIRPKYLRKYRENEPIVEEGVVIPSVWKVGDLVDWFKDHCYWTGTVLEVKGNGFVKIELLPEPDGEGGVYDCKSKDLRPWLEWSLEHGWTVPYSKDGENRQCAKLVKPLPEEISEEQQVGGEETSEEQVGGEEETIDEQMEGEEEEEEEEQKTVHESKGDDGDLQLNIMKSKSVEAAVMDLEEQIARIEWLQDMLSQDSTETTSSWKYEDYCPSSTRK